MDLQSISALLVVMSFSGFVYLFAVFSILLFGMGFRGSGGGLLAVIVSFVLAAALTPGGQGAVGGITEMMSLAAKDPKAFEDRQLALLEKKADPQVTAGLAAVADPAPETAANPQPSRGVRQAALVISQLREAFSLGLHILVPFLIVDLLVATIVGLLGAVQIPVSLVGVPLKILLFVSVDGWRLISERLLAALAAG